MHSWCARSTCDTPFTSMKRATTSRPNVYPAPLPRRQPRAPNAGESKHAPLRHVEAVVIRVGVAPHQIGQRAFVRHLHTGQTRRTASGERCTSWKRSSTRI
jgi:hypothetical protein